MLLFGILGKPLQHSLSPILHHYLLNHNDKVASYNLFEVSGDELSHQLQKLKSEKYLGLNVTIPFKEKIVPLLDWLSEDARAIGAVNTVKIEDGRFLGFNTDANGFQNALIRNECDSEKKQALILGAGGAARAVVFALIKNNIDSVVILNRTIENAEKLLEDIHRYTHFANIHVAPLNQYEIGKRLSQCKILINTTPVGMFPDVNAMPYDFGTTKQEGLTVVDLVYNPLVTQFLCSAKKVDAKAIDGLDMLIFQALQAEKIWFEHPVEYDYSELRHILTQRLSDGSN